MQVSVFGHAEVTWSKMITQPQNRRSWPQNRRTWPQDGKIAVLWPKMEPPWLAETHLKHWSCWGKAFLAAKTNKMAEQNTPTGLEHDLPIAQLALKIQLEDATHKTQQLPKARTALQHKQRAATQNRTAALRLHNAKLLRTGANQNALGAAPQSTENATWPAFRALDTHDLRRGLKRNFTSIPGDQHARSPQKVALRNPKNATLPAFRALDTHDLHRGLTRRNHVSEVLQTPRNHEAKSYEKLHWPRKSILNFKSQTYNPSQESSPSTSKHSIGAGALRLPRKTQSFARNTPANVLARSTKHCACHDFHKVPDSLHLPRKLTFLTSTCDGFLGPAGKMKFMSQNVEHQVKQRLRNCDFRDAHFARACAVEINIQSQNSNPAQTKPPAQQTVGVIRNLWPKAPTTLFPPSPIHNSLAITFPTLSIRMM